MDAQGLGFHVCGHAVWLWCLHLHDMHSLEKQPSKWHLCGLSATSHPRASGLQHQCCGCCGAERQQSPWQGDVHAGGGPGDCDDGGALGAAASAARAVAACVARALPAHAHRFLPAVRLAVRVHGARQRAPPACLPQPVQPSAFKLHQLPLTAFCLVSAACAECGPSLRDQVESADSLPCCALTAAE